MDTLRKCIFFHPFVHVIGFQKCMTAISGQSCKKLAALQLFWIILNDKNKNFSKVHIRNLLSLLWTCMSILVRGGSLFIYYIRCMKKPLFRGILEQRDKKKISYSIGERRTQWISSKHALKKGGVTFCCDSSKTNANKILLNLYSCFCSPFLHLTTEITSV